MRVTHSAHIVRSRRADTAGWNIYTWQSGIYIYLPDRSVPSRKEEEKMVALLPSDLLLKSGAFFCANCDTCSKHRGLVAKTGTMQYQERGTHVVQNCDDMHMCAQNDLLLITISRADSSHHSKLTYCLQDKRDIETPQAQRACQQDQRQMTDAQYKTRLARNLFADKSSPKSAAVIRVL